MTEYPFTAQHRTLTGKLNQDGVTDNICNCDEFKKALENGSAEGCIECEGVRLIEWCDDGYYTGNMEHAIKFCPWCGKEVQCPSPS